MQATLKNGNEIFLQGDVVLSTITILQKNIVKILRENLSLVEYRLDFSEVTAVNSAALALLVELKKWAIIQQKTIVFSHLPQRLLALAQLCGVAEWLDLDLE